MSTVRVLKAGGAVLASPSAVNAFADHIAELTRAGGQVVVVHGGGELISELHEQLKIETVRHGGLRATPTASMRIVTMALRGEANAGLVARLVARGVEAIGLSGVDLGLLRSNFLNRAKLGRVGGPPRVDVVRLRRLLGLGMAPVIAPVCLGPDGDPVNVNADTVAHAIAVSLGAESLDFVSDIPGVYARSGQLRARIGAAELPRLLQSDEVRGGMIPKLQASLAAVHAGVGRVRIGSLATLAEDRATEVVL